MAISFAKVDKPGLFLLPTLRFCTQITFLELLALVPDSFLPYLSRQLSNRHSSASFSIPPFLPILWKRKKPNPTHSLSYPSAGTQQTRCPVDRANGSIKLWYALRVSQQALKNFCASTERTCEFDLKQHAEFGKKTAGPCNCIKKLSGLERESHSCLMRKVGAFGLKLFFLDWEQSKAKEKGLLLSNYFKLCLYWWSR